MKAGAASEGLRNKTLMRTAFPIWPGGQGSNSAVCLAKQNPGWLQSFPYLAAIVGGTPEILPTVDKRIMLRRLGSDP